MHLPRIVIVGQVCIDHNETEHAAYTKWGSIPLYMADYCQRQLGLQPDIITSYGKDFAEYAAQFSLHPNHPTTESTLIFRNIIKPTGRQWFSENTASAVPPEITPQLQQLVTLADILVLAVVLPNYTAEYVTQLFASAKASCLKVMCAQGYLGQAGADSLIKPRDFTEAPQLLPLFDVTIYSSDDHPNAIGLAKDWQRSLSDIRDVVVTEGSNGACIVSNGQTKQVPTIPIADDEIVDSVGCGDIFAMALAYNYYRSNDLVSAVKAAHQAARSKLLASAPAPTSM